jgi:hypothetical protein
VKLREEISNFYKIPLEVVTRNCLKIRYCRYCHETTASEFDYEHNVEGRKTLAIKKKLGKSVGIKNMSMFGFTKRDNERGRKIKNRKDSNADADMSANRTGG